MTTEQANQLEAIYSNLDLINIKIPKLYNLGQVRTFDISIIVGKENVGNYTEDNFILTVPNFSKSVTGTSNRPGYLYRATAVASYTDFVKNYDIETGILSLAGGVLNLNAKGYYNDSSSNYSDALAINPSQNFEIIPVIYFISDFELAN